MAEFPDGEALLAATKSAYSAGFRRMDAYSPNSVEGLSEALGFSGTKLPFLVMGGGIIGAISGFGLQYFVHAIDYPLNIGGRPFNSWPSFIPVTFELTILCAALTTVLGMILLNGFPMPYHPVFNIARFENASTDGFFLCIESQDPKFEMNSTKEFLRSLNAKEVMEVKS